MSGRAVFAYVYLRCLLYCRADVGQCNLLYSIYETLSALIQSAAPDCYEMILVLLPKLIEKLETNFSMQGELQCM